MKAGINSTIQRYSKDQPTFIRHFNNSYTTRPRAGCTRASEQLPRLHGTTLVRVTNDGNNDNGNNSDTTFCDIKCRHEPYRPKPTRRHRETIQLENGVNYRKRNVNIKLFIRVTRPYGLYTRIKDVTTPVVLIILLLRRDYRHNSKRKKNLFYFQNKKYPTTTRHSNINCFGLRRFRFAPILSSQSNTTTIPVTNTTTSPN